MIKSNEDFLVVPINLVFGDDKCRKTTYCHAETVDENIGYQLFASGEVPKLVDGYLAAKNSTLVVKPQKPLDSQGKIDESALTHKNN